jgi:RND superfamily putative drug exporter
MGIEPPAMDRGNAPTKTHRWGVRMVHGRRIVFGVWAIALIASGALYPSLRRALGAPDYSVSGSQSARVEKLVEKGFPKLGTETDALVFHAASLTTSEPAYHRFVASLVESMRHQKGVKSVISPFDEGAQLQLSLDEHSAFAVVALTGDAQQRFENDTSLQRVVMRAARGTSSGVGVSLTGYSPVTKDLVRVQTNDVERAEAIGLPVAFVMLLIALGSLVAAFLPLLLAGAGLLLTYGALALLIKVAHFDNFLISIVAMVGIGIGIDYALIIISRFREELARRPADGNDPERVAEAVGVAIATAGRTILFSGVICALAILAMLLLRAAVFREITVGVVAVVACTLLAALTLLPAILGALGTRINSGALPTRMQPANARAADPDRPGGWARWALGMMRHPLGAILASVALLLVCSIPILGLRYGLNLGVFAVGEAPSGRGEQILAHSFAPGAVSPARIIITGGSTAHVDTEAAQAMTHSLYEDPRVAHVSEQEGRGGVVLSVITSVPIDSTSANNLVARIRRVMAPELHHQWGVSVLTGGATAIMLDLAHETSVRFPIVLAVILGFSLIFLLIVFRSPLLAVKAILMNLLATGAMLGIVVFVFQEGHGQQLFGFTSTGFIQCFVPLTVFALVYGLSMDYEVFLIRRIQEEWNRTHDNPRSVATGVEHTARPITAAAAIMVAVFGSFVTANLLELKQLGFAVAVGIAIDATLIRLVLVPALMRVFGSWNWWMPIRLQRILPNLEPAKPPAHQDH